MDLELPKHVDIDYTRPVIGVGNFTRIEPKREEDGKYYCAIDRDIVKHKYELWNRIGMTDMLSEHSGATKIEKLKATLLLKDKTILSYANFKLHNRPLKMRWYQDLLLSDDYDRILFIGSNQIGKSVTLDDDAATDFLIDHGKEWRGLLVSNSLTQSKERMGNIRHLLDTSSFDYKTEDVIDKKTGKQLSITVISYTFYNDEGRPKYTNKLICCPHTSAALGYPCDVIWCDEIEFWENVKGGIIHWIKQVAIPRLFETRGKMKVYSNPVEGGVMEILMREKEDDGKPLWHTYRFNYWDREDATQKEFNRNSIGMTNAEVCSTLLGDFARSKGSFLSQKEIEDQYSEELEQLKDNAGYGKETYWFLDVGEVHDQCALIGGYALPNPNELAQEEGLPLIHAFYIYKYPVGYPISRVIGVPLEKDEVDGWEDEAENNPTVKEVLTDYSEDYNGKDYLPAFAFDATSNMALLPLLQVVGIDAIPIKFTGPGKWEMYQRYQMYTQQRWFKRNKDKDNNAISGPDGKLSTFPYQASKLRVKKRSETKTRYGQIHHENENDLDDTQDAVCGMIHMIENPDISSLSCELIPHGSSPKQQDLNETQNLSEQNKEKYLDGQYIPSFMRGQGLDNWIERKEQTKR